MFLRGVAGEIKPVTVAPEMTVVCFKKKSSAVSVSSLSVLGRRDSAPSLPSALPVLTMTLVLCADTVPENNPAPKITSDTNNLCFCITRSFSLNVIFQYLVELMANVLTAATNREVVTDPCGRRNSRHCTAPKSVYLRRRKQDSRWPERF